jgi:hypothetical protein
MIGVPLFLALVLIAGAPGFAATEPPELFVQAPNELAGASGRIAQLDPERVRTIMELVGVSGPEPPIRVILATEESAEAEAMPSWVLGVAYGSLSTIVLFPERTPSYPDGSFEEVLLHEIAHVLIARAAAFQQVPRWFDEGLAMVAATKWSLADRSWLTAAAMLDSELPLAELDQKFASSRGEVARAYALSGAFMRDLFQRSRPTIARDILARRALGLSFDEAFRRSHRRARSSRRLAKKAPPHPPRGDVGRGGGRPRGNGRRHPVRRAHPLAR